MESSIRKQKQYVQGIVGAGEHLLALVNDFLDLSKIDAQREELFLEKVAVADVCLAAVSIIEAQIKKSRARVVCRYCLRCWHLPNGSASYKTNFDQFTFKCH